MGFPLLTFEQSLSSSIAGRGLDYYESGAVANLARDGNTYLATVYGTEAYQVEITVHEGQVESWACDCPYDYGPICKHVAAVLFEVREVEHDPARAAEVAGKEGREPVNAILGQLPEEELRQLLQFFAQRHDKVRVHLLTKYAHLIRDPGREHFQTLIHTLIEAHSGGKGWIIDYRNASRLGSEVYGLLEDTRSNISARGALQLVYACEEAIRQLCEAIQDADDSGGNMGDAIKHAFSILSDLCEEGNEMQEEVMDYVYKLSLREGEQPLYQGWDWAGDWRYLAANAAQSPEQAEKVMGKLDFIIKQKEKAGIWERYEAESAAGLKLQLLEQWYSPEKAQAFLQGNLSYTSFRRIAIEQAMTEKHYEEVRRLAEEGIIIDTQNNHRGLVQEWEQWLLKVSEATGDSSAQSRWLEKLYLDTRKMEYYRELKSHLSPAQFGEKVEAFIAHFRRLAPSGHAAHFDPTIAAIYLEEGRLEDLMEMLQSANPSLLTLDQYAPVLAGKYPDHFLILYDLAIREAMHRASNQRSYQEVISYLNKLERLGGRAAAREIAADWRVQYWRRRAMLEELRGAGW